MINFLVHVYEDTGKIFRVEFPSANFKPEGVTGNERVIHLTPDNMPPNFTNPGYFIDNFWYDNGFVEIGPKPNQHAIWDGSQWTWDAETLLNDIRVHRDRRLRASDWTQLDDASLTGQEKAEAVVYRQLLRDFPDTVDNPNSVDDVTWPTKPPFLD